MRAFYKSLFTSLIATTVDFLLTIFIKEVCGIWYLAANVAGMIAGGCTQFTLNRKWTFKEGKSKLPEVALRFFVIWLSGLILNTSGLWLLTHFFGVNYIISKLIVSAALAVSVNFYLQKRYVFR